MKRVTLVLFILLVSVGFLFAQENVVENLTAHMNFLCSDEMNGRKAGSAEGLVAAQYIFDQFEAMGLNPQMEEFSKGKMRNVVGEIPSKNGKYVIIGAHYDHIGKSWGKVCNGADDNASGTSALIEVARMLSADRGNLKYGVLFIGFDGEEQGLLGSKYNAGQLDKSGYDAVLMINMDMVGHLKDEGRLICEGAGTMAGGEAFLRDNQIDGIGIRSYPQANSNGVMTDTYYYDKAGIPVLNFFTGLETSEYHRPTDDVETIDIPGMALVVKQIAALAENVPDTVEPTGVSSYEDKTVSFGVTFEVFARSVISFTDGTSFASDTQSAGLFASFPLTQMIGGNLFLVPELNFRYYEATMDKEKGKTYQFTLPVSLAYTQKILGIEQSIQLGPYYSVVFDDNSNMHQEAGLKFGLTFKPYNNIDIMNHLGIGMYAYYGLANISNSESCTVDTTSNMSFVITYSF
ncbi:MAG: M28 family peptidase [Treponema sp.]|nr:M28 family peptidase [Candidatus Treponema caballi]